ncbi:multiple inositol polyphosphate phosphatase 1-like [Adelges cooleyi]|uniref:multiple inositol polyphosphate phosphatase 1-like n=1 Tax=Adelges cooleyi TaxID=133065 RepID=UPI00217F980F|nr:multiple inositol polyphosphate phosphatase 1-like [Adelges cooleyi]
MRDKLNISENAEMCPSDIKAINDWHPTNIATNAAGLVKKGRDEIIELAQRIRNAFPDIFTKRYKKKHYDALTRPEQYCKETGRLFLKTIFNNSNINVDTVPVCVKDDKILMIDSHMENYRSVKKMYNREKIHFLHTDHLKNVSQKIFKILEREPKGPLIDYKLVYSLYNTCAIERSLDEQSIPPLCRLFSKEDLNVLEYTRDLLYYFEEGYGNPFSAKYACPMAIRLLESFKNKIEENGPKGVFYFGNSINILNLYVMLGLSKDKVPLMSSNYESMKDRMWRTSKMAPLAANFMAVLSKTGKRSQLNYYVQFYFNEKLTSITLNDGSGCEKCPWSKIKEKLEKYIQDYSCRSGFNAIQPDKSYSNQYWHFSTMTAYRLVFSDEIKKRQNDTPVQIFMVMRHNMTLPSDDFFKEWTRYQGYKYKITAKTKLSRTDIINIQDFDGDTHKDSKDIVLHIKIEAIATRIRRAFQNLFSTPFNSENYKVLSRPEKICKNTGEMFLQSLFKNESITSVPEWENSNQLLMVDELNENIVESEKFKKSYVINKVLERVAIHMGLEPGELDFGFINFAYETFRLRRAYDESSFHPLGKIFCQKDLKALEYIEELKWYYTAGYGNPSSLQQACPMAKSLLETFRTKTGGSGPNGAFHFGNAHNIFHLYVILGLAKDKAPLDSANYIAMEERQWKSSTMVPLLANCMAVLFRSDNGQYKVSFYFNENRKLITLDGGRTCEVCEWSDIEKLLTLYIEKNGCTSH